MEYRRSLLRNALALKKISNAISDSIGKITMDRAFQDLINSPRKTSRNLLQIATTLTLSLRFIFAFFTYLFS